MLRTAANKRNADEGPSEATQPLTIQQFLPLAEGYAVV